MTDGNSYRMGLRPHLHEALCYKDVQFSILSFEVYGTSFGVTPRGHFSLLSHNKLLGHPSSWKRCKGKSDTIHGFKSLFISKSPLELSWVQDPQTTHRCSYLLVGYRYGGFLSHRATPSHHPFFFGIFPWIFFTIHSELGVPPYQLRTWRDPSYAFTVHLAFRGRTVSLWVLVGPKRCLLPNMGLNMG